MFHDYKYIYVRLIRMVVSNYTNVTKEEERKRNAITSKDIKHDLRPSPGCRSSIERGKYSEFSKRIR